MKKFSAKPKTPVPVMQKAVELLSRREYSQKELRQVLLRKEYTLEEIEPVLQKLAESDWQSDARTLKSFISSSLSKGHGAQKIKMSAMQKGLDIDEVAQSIVEAEIDWDAKAQELAQRRFGAPPYDRTKQIKVVSFLLRRGFSQPVSWAAARLTPAEDDTLGPDNDTD